MKKLKCRDFEKYFTNEKKRKYCFPRSLWRSYCRQSDLIVFVVDSEDQERLEEARLELELIVKVIGRNVPVLILANKQDLPGNY